VIDVNGDDNDDDNDDFNDADSLDSMVSTNYTVYHILWRYPTCVYHQLDATVAPLR
jgi:hypothetical protein